LAGSPGGALLVLPGPSTIVQRDAIIAAALDGRLPAMYPFRAFEKSGGLMACGPDLRDTFRRAATYVDRILRGEQPSNLPVQQPTKFELIINLKAAQAIDAQVIFRKVHRFSFRKMLRFQAITNSVLKPRSTEL
jgi:putative ABC transport system substrate-binding protein